ncbi:hypothetical protein ACIQVK_03720 [Streptomyces sp. NPDC090493]|uniref:hypothetical protein n=1 Tax=Streptomyces sp. NPDC090493 TaxID=3365964 RepID=UPI003812672F
MSDHDVTLLAVGAATGIYLMLLLQAVFQILDDRRDRKARLAAQALLDEARARAEA